MMNGKTRENAMSRTRAHVASVLAAASLALGCGGGGAPSVTSSTEEATVKGTITVLGKPATQGKVTFDPSNINRPNASVRTVEVGKDGTYEVKTLVGPNSVSVNVPKPAKPAPGMSPELSVDVPAGGTTFDVALPVKGD
jgi:hypothetical protein